MHSDILRTIDLSSRLVRHSDFPEQEDIVVEVRPGHDEMALLRAVAGRLGYAVAETTPAEILRHVGENGMLTDEYWADDAATGDPEWYRVSMLDMQILAMKAGSDPSEQEAMRRLARWVGGEGTLVLVFLVDEMPAEAERRWRTVFAAPTVDIDVADGMRTLSDAAARGPWEVFSLSPGAFEICTHGDYATGGVCQIHSRADADFIVAAANHARAMLER